MKTCPFCAERIQDEAIKCRYCGEFIDGRPTASAGFVVPAYWGYEYRSQLELFGLPLLHIAYGVNPTTGAPRLAKGIIAIGNIAAGVFAIGGLAVGLFVLGGVGIGLVALGGIALGAAAFGGLSMGLVLAVGGVALSMYIAMGGVAIAPYTISALGVDLELVELLARFWPEVWGLFPDIKP